MIHLIHRKQIKTISQIEAKFYYPLTTTLTTSRLDHPLIRINYRWLGVPVLLTPLPHPVLPLSLHSHCTQPVFLFHSQGALFVVGQERLAFDEATVEAVRFQAVDGTHLEVGAAAKKLVADDASCQVGERRAERRRD